MSLNMAGLDRQIASARRRRARALTKSVGRIMKLKRELQLDYLDAQAVLRDCIDTDDVNLWLVITSGFREALEKIECVDAALSSPVATESDDGGRAHARAETAPPPSRGEDD